ncbi:alpha/beta fold hydrolase [Coleofasciculus sp. FACHB-64]|uniref:YqiA/YcfP family alpha/beta fold hydrolase n=1 Tax=Cyanophyceae TaxID=3028117 RepID=UPI00168893D9|nr:YqiA/YcfP family alpha/beta fold hydrolase [Coleofasciculus sp. FACHB-64]MBD2046212.1 alpha/beta fold hydrolase [Coleofasciculus sp. FACHB-64]
MLDYLYLHGFASSPQSTKAIYLRDRLSSLKIPDFNQGDFSHLTITRQIKQVAAEFPPNSMPVTVIGSSLGGLTAAWVGEKYPQVQRLVLLAPAFEFLTHWLLRLGEEQLQQWQTEQYLPVYHYGEKRSLPLHYQFVTDAVQYQDEQLQRPIPTLLLHGRHDEVIPIAASRNYAASRPWVKFIELEDDHSLGNVLPEIWDLIKAFCQ